MEQWERQVQSIHQLRVGEAFVRLPNDQVHKVKTPALPSLTEPPQALAQVKQYYLDRYFEPPRVVDTPLTAAAQTGASTAPVIRRRRPRSTTQPGRSKGTVFQRRREK